MFNYLFQEGRLSLFFVMLLSPGFVFATEFSDIIKMTINHPSVHSAISSSSADSFDIDKAKAANNIQVNGGLSSTAYSGQPGYDNNPISPHISVSKILYDHGRTDAIVEGKEAEFNMQQEQVLVTRESLNQQALSLFTSAVTNNQVVNVLDQEIVALSDLLKRVKAIANIDSGRASEISQVATRLSAIQASRDMSYITLQQSLNQLSLMVNSEVKLTTNLPDLSKVGALPENLDVATTALKDNPSWILGRYRRQQAISAVTLASKWNRPQWKVQVSFDSPKRNGEMEPFKAATVQLSSDLSLWDGGAGSSGVKAETQRLAASEQELDATMRGLKQQLVQLWVSLPLRRQQINALSEQSASALKTWKAGEVQFFAGQRPLTDLISFATDYYSSLASYQEQKVQYLATQWQIVASLGKLSQLVQTMPTLTGQPLSSIDILPPSEKNIVTQPNFAGYTQGKIKRLERDQDVNEQGLNINKNNIKEKTTSSDVIPLINIEHKINKEKQKVRSQDDLREWPWK